MLRNVTQVIAGKEAAPHPLSLRKGASQGVRGAVGKQAGQGICF